MKQPNFEKKAKDVLELSTMPNKDMALKCIMTIIGTMYYQGKCDAVNNMRTSIAGHAFKTKK